MKNDHALTRDGLCLRCTACGEDELAGLCVPVEDWNAAMLEKIDASMRTLDLRVARHLILFRHGMLLGQLGSN